MEVEEIRDDNKKIVLLCVMGKENKAEQEDSEKGLNDLL